MSNRIKVVPAEGRAVPDPEALDLLPEKGREVDDSIWWRRRLADGDVTISEISTKAAKAAKTEVTA